MVSPLNMASAMDASKMGGHCFFFPLVFTHVNCMDVMCDDIELIKVECGNALTIECRLQRLCKLNANMGFFLLLFCLNDAKDCFTVFYCAVITHMYNGSSESMLPTRRDCLVAYHTRENLF